MARPPVDHLIDHLRNRLARPIAVAALLALLPSVSAFAEQPSSSSGASNDAKSTVVDTAGESGHPAPVPPAGASDNAAPNHAAPPPAPDARTGNSETKREKGDKADRSREGSNDQGTKPGLKHGNKTGDTSRDKLEIAVPRRLPKMSARDRLFKKIEAVKVTHVNHPHANSRIPPSGPVRNAIGVVPIDVHGNSAPQQGPGPSASHLASIPANGPIGSNAAPNTVHPPLGQTGLTAPPHGTINGTTVQHIGTGPNTLGGPSRLATGINGTTFKSKH